MPASSICVGGRDQLFVSMHARRRLALADIDNLAKRGALLAQGRYDAGKRLIDKQNLCAAVVQPVGYFGRRQARIHRHEDAARPRHGEGEFQIAIAVERKNGSASALAEGKFIANCAGQFPHPFGELAVGVATGAHNGGDIVTGDLNRTAERLREIHVLSPLVRPIAAALA